MTDESQSTGNEEIADALRMLGAVALLLLGAVALFLLAFTLAVAAIFGNTEKDTQPPIAPLAAASKDWVDSPFVNRHHRL